MVCAHPALPTLPARLRAVAAWCAALAIGCQPVQQALQPVAPVAIVQPGAPQFFAAPPVATTDGVVVDPFAVSPYAEGLPPGAAPVIDASDGGSSRIHVPVVNRDWTWEQIVDVVDDYFRIERERQVQIVGDVVTEGRIDSFPEVSSTIIEPHRHDTVGRYNRWESTFQTIRRRAAVRVIPDASGYLVDVTVQKDLEDLPRPEHSTAGAAVFRFDNSLASPGVGVSRTRLASTWIELGRDPPLERRILSDLQERLTPQAAPGFAP